LVQPKKNDDVKVLRKDLQHDLTLIAREIERINNKIDFLMEVQCRRICDENNDRGMIV